MSLKEQLQNKINNKTKPLGALGQLEDIALKIGAIQGTLTPELKKPAILVFAADHGLADEGVSPFPKDVTWQMVMNFLNGGAAINVFCKQNNIELKVIDAGVDYDFQKCEGLIHCKVKNGSKNALKEEAMSVDECRLAMNRGAEQVQILNEHGCNIVGFGEMGIGNTSSASLLMSRYLNIPVSQCVGRGTGHDDLGLQKKVGILEKVAQKHRKAEGAMNILAAMGGIEIAMIAGGMLEAYKKGMIIMVDGFIATSALLAAHALNNEILNNCLFTHASNEQGHKKMLECLNAKPILNLGMRLGEGTGAAVAFPVIKSAVEFINNMASFEDAGVSGN
jgi:nicotinate-nucleotide--dimethylbenzimidazole phosphoribosyltransferase